MNVLAIGCHPDDLEIGCGGTLSAYVKQGHRVFMCHVANGDKGHAVIMPDELKEIWIPSTFMPTLPGKLFFMKELAGPLIADCN